MQVYEDAHVQYEHNHFSSNNNSLLCFLRVCVRHTDRDANIQWSPESLAPFSKNVLWKNVFYPHDLLQKSSFSLKIELLKKNKEVDI